MKKRLSFIDVAKGILILLVVYGHIYGTTKNMDCETVVWVRQSCNLIIPFYMPCFFVITGYCSNFNKEFLPFLITSFKTILFPGIILGFLVLLLRDFSIESLKCYIYDLLFYGGRYWFLTALFLSRIIYWVGNRYVAPKVLYVICILLFILGYLLGIYYKGIEYWWFIHVLLLMPYLPLGQCMREKGFLDRYNLKTTAPVFVVFFFFTVLLCHEGILQRDYFYHVPGITLKLHNFNLSMLVPLLVLSLSGSLFVLGISKLINSSKILEYLGKNSLVIYCVHVTILSIVLQKLGGAFFLSIGRELSCILSIFIAYILTVVISCAIASVLNQKYIKVLIGKF